MRKPIWHPTAGLRFIGRAALIMSVPALVAACQDNPLSNEEMAMARNLALQSLRPLPDDPSNRFAENERAVEFGRELFFDTRLSLDGKVSCASCHQPDNQFQDGTPLAVGLSTNVRRTMPIAGAQWGAWFFWDGRKDSQWSQALGPLENPVEHALTRTDIVKRVLADYPDSYSALFGDPPQPDDWPDNASPLLVGEPRQNWMTMSKEEQMTVNTAFANIGKAIAAYERTLLPQENRFDRFIAALSEGRTPEDDEEFSEREIAGFRVFIGKGRCTHCHSGPRMTDDFFHNTGVPHSEAVGAVDFGRAAMVDWILRDPFSCLGDYSDAEPGQCRELRFMSTDVKLFEGAFKTPTLRGVSTRPPYMHAGQIATLEQVVEHYNEAPDPFSDVPDINGEIVPHGRHSDTVPLSLSEKEKVDLAAFLRTL